MVTPTDDDESGEWLFLAEWMKDKGFSDQRLADEVVPKVTRETVTRWRTHQHRLNPGKIAAIATALGIKPTDLWRRPSERPSLDALIHGAPDELQDTVTDVVQRMVSGRR